MINLHRRDRSNGQLKALLADCGPDDTDADGIGRLTDAETRVDKRQ
jgi:hypothetical protein